MNHRVIVLLAASSLSENASGALFLDTTFVIENDHVVPFPATRRSYHDVAVQGSIAGEKERQGYSGCVGVRVPLIEDENRRTSRRKTRPIIAYDILGHEKRTARQQT